MSAKSVESIVESGTELFIPLNKLKKSPRNARKTPHSEAAIEALAASIAAKGIGVTVNNLTVRLHRARQALKERLEQACVVCLEESFWECRCGDNRAEVRPRPA